MRSLEVKKTLKRDADGKLRSIGVEWGEQDASLDWTLTQLLKLGMGCMLGGILTCWMPIGAMTFVVGLILTPGAFAAMVFFPESPRSIYFDLDGRILAPVGIPDGWGATSINVDHAEVVSIEARRQPANEQDKNGGLERYAVVIIASTGDLVTVSRNTTERTALKASVQLTHALNQLRLEMATGAELIAGGVRRNDDDDGEPWAVIS